MKHWRHTIGVVIVCGILFAISPVSVKADTYASPNYQINQVFVGNGGSLSLSSPNYSAQASVGALGVGHSSSTNFQAQAGYDTNRSPYLELGVTNSSTSLGTLSSSTTATATAKFLVKAYLANGYVVQTNSPPPSSGSHTLQPLATATASVAGQEQFGMNLVADTNPSSLSTTSSNPVQNPDNTFSFGSVNPATCASVSSGYNIPNEYKYAEGDVIAASCLSSGETDYTISYIFNVSNTTPGGHYTFNDVIVATATY